MLSVFPTVLNFLSMQYCSLPEPHNFILSPHRYDSYLCYCLQQQNKTTGEGGGERKRGVASRCPKVGKAAQKNFLRISNVCHKYFSSLFTYRGKVRAIRKCLGEMRVPYGTSFSKVHQNRAMKSSRGENKHQAHLAWHIWSMLQPSIS